MYFLVEGFSFEYFKRLVWVVYFAWVVDLCVSFSFTYSFNKASKKASGCPILIVPSFYLCKYCVWGISFCKSGSFFYHFPDCSGCFYYWFFWRILIADTFD